MKVSADKKQLWMSGVIIVTAMFAAAFFPTDNTFQSFIAGIVFLVILPFLFIRFSLREHTASFGMTTGNVLSGVVWLSILLVVFVLCLFGVVSRTDILSQVSVPLSIRLNFSVFLLYIVIAGTYIFMFEFFFRGFVFFVLEKFVGLKAILIQALLNMLFVIAVSHWKFDGTAAVVGGMAIFSGWLAARSRSILYPFLFSYVSAILGIVTAILFIR